MREQEHLFQQVLQVDIFRANILHMLISILAPFLANASKVVIIGLQLVPVFLIDSSGIGNAIRVFADDDPFILARPGEYGVERDDGSGGADGFHSTLEVLDCLEDFSDGHPSLRETNIDLPQDLKGIDDALVHSSGVQGEGEGILFVGAQHSHVASKHDSIIEVLPIAVKGRNVGGIPHSVREGKVHVPPMDDGAISLTSYDGSA
mmetsp:Transcript_20936/g.20009  ORF Transcript_20936/g.20009 Transcript_20936/m.20009 type:complete len:205 (-) Transcript_20936:42-656(-)